MVEPHTTIQPNNQNGMNEMKEERKKAYQESNLQFFPTSM